LWRAIFVVLLVAVVGAYFWSARTEYPHGGSRLGLIYGTAGYALILLLAFFGIRKRWYRSRFGTLEQWLQSHIYLGILVMVILILHTGFRMHDRVAVATLILVGIVVGSGILGALLYVTLPRLLTEVETDLSPEKISEELNQIAKGMARMASGKSQPFQRIHEGLMRESKPGWFAGWRLLLSPAKQKKGVSADWSNLLALVPKGEQEQLRQLLVDSRKRKELLIRLVLQQRYKNALESWLYIHVPFTIALLLLAIVHIAAVFYYGQIQ
jgi:predicted membrane channel-forming protein YqfA (hemolysin III family)